MANASQYDGRKPSDPNDLGPHEYDVDDQKSGIHKKRRLRPGSLTMSIFGGILSLTCYAQWAPWVARSYGVSLPWNVQIPILVALFISVSSLSYAYLCAKSAD